MSKSMICRAWVILAAILLPTIAYSDVVILTPDSDSARDIAKQIQSQIEEPSVVAHKLEHGKRTGLVVAIGDGSFQEAIDSQSGQSGPILGTFLSATSAPPSTTRPAYRIFSDPSPQAIASFLKLKFSNRAVGYIYTPSEATMIKIVQKELQNSSVKLVAIKFSGNTNSDIRSLIRERIDTMFISRNRDIYKSDSIRFTLEQLFRKKIPVVTTVHALVKVGATVSIAPTSDDVASLTSASINAIAKGSPPKESDLFVPKMDIQVNKVMSDLFDLNFEGDAK